MNWTELCYLATVLLAAVFIAISCVAVCRARRIRRLSQAIQSQHGDTGIWTPCDEDAQPLELEPPMPAAEVLQLGGRYYTRGTHPDERPIVRLLAIHANDDPPSAFVFSEMHGRYMYIPLERFEAETAPQ